MNGAWTALVLAAGRPDDPLATAEGVSNKTLIDVHGRSILQRVLDALAAAPSVGRVVVAIEDAKLLADLSPRPEAAKAAERVVDTVAACLRQLGPPLLIVTGDHALLTPSMVEEFLAGAVAAGAGAAVGLAPATTIQAAYPNVRRTYLKFADDGYSGCNLFALASAHTSVTSSKNSPTTRPLTEAMMSLSRPLLPSGPSNTISQSPRLPRALPEVWKVTPITSGGRTTPIAGVRSTSSRSRTARIDTRCAFSQASLGQTHPLTRTLSFLMSLRSSWK